MRYTADGTPVTSFSVATSEKWNQDGEKREKTTWWKVSAWRKLAEICNEYVTKGMLVLVEGTMAADENGNPRVWNATDGTPRASYELTARKVQFLSGKREDGAPESDDASVLF